MSVSSIHVEENSGVVVTNASLSVLDQDTPENEIVFTVVRKPSYGRHCNTPGGGRCDGVVLVSNLGKIQPLKLFSLCKVEIG